MSIIYALCARGNQTILSNYSSYRGNFQTASLDILQKLNLSKTYTHYQTPKYKFYTYFKQGFTFLVMTEVGYQMRFAISFLRDIQEIFFRKYSKERRTQALAYSLTDFKLVLRQRMGLFNDKTKVDKFVSIQKQLSQLEQILLVKMEKDVDREDIDIIVKKSEDIIEMRKQIEKSTRKILHNKMWWKDRKLTSSIIALLIIIVFFVIWTICGLKFQRC